MVWPKLARGRAKRKTSLGEFARKAGSLFLLHREEAVEAPAEFVSRLEREFDGRLRIRWSAKLQEFHIEQKVGHGRIPPARVDEGSDDLIRARDGYHFVMAVRAGDRMPCPRCGYELRVPVRDTVDVRCGYCLLRGRKTSVVCGYWPLDDSLLEHLRKIDPTKDVDLAAEADAANALLLKSLENDAVRPGEAAADELYNRLVGIPQVGYTGKVFTGSKAA